jgi:hypothetical protein
MKTKLKPFAPGALVSVINCVGFFSVIRRVRPNVYLVSFKGSEIEFNRNQLKIKS